MNTMETNSILWQLFDSFCLCHPLKRRLAKWLTNWTGALADTLFLFELFALKSHTMPLVVCRCCGGACGQLSRPLHQVGCGITCLAHCGYAAIVRWAVSQEEEVGTTEGFSMKSHNFWPERRTSQLTIAQWNRRNWCAITHLGASFIKASFPKSSPVFRVATVPLPCITTSTDPLSKMYQERPSSPWLNTVNGLRVLRDKTRC